MFKFEKLEVWDLALEYIDLIYGITGELPKNEEFNLKSQTNRAATSIALNIAEGSTGQTDAEQARFLSFAIRSLIETVACQALIRRRGYVSNTAQLDEARRRSETLARKLQAMRRTVMPQSSMVREEATEYQFDDI